MSGIDGETGGMPKKALRAFEAYVAMDGKTRSLAALARQPDMPSERTLERYSQEYHWADLLADRMQREADEVAREARERRAALRGNMESGVTSAAMFYSLELSGVCGRCRGKRTVAAFLADGRQAAETCPRCAGTGVADISRVPIKTAETTFKLLEGMWGRPTEDAGQEEDTGITVDDFRRQQAEMLKRAGMDVVEGEA